MKKLAILLGVPIVGLAGVLVASTASRMRDLPDVVHADGSVTLPNGWEIHPAGRAIALPGDLPLKMTFTDDGKKLIVLTSGWHNQGLVEIDPGTEKVAETLDLGKAFVGMSIDGGQAYVSGGNAKIRTVALAAFSRGSDFGPAATLANFNKPSSPYVTGVLAKGGVVWAADTNSDSIIRFAGDPKAQTATAKVGYRPYDLALSPDGSTLAASNWGDKSVSLLDPTTLQFKAIVAVGAHPNELVYASDGRLFVANSGSNTVSVIKNGKVVEAIRTSLDPRDPVGSTPDALAISPSGKTLYVANADNNDVAVVDISEKASRVVGFIPTGWYPTSLAVSPDGKKLFVGTGKGLGFRANAPAIDPDPRVNYANGSKYDYIGRVLSGNVNVVDLPTQKQLDIYTKEVFADVPKPPTEGIAEITGALHKIKHVVYVIRENRTYDQVFGDISAGNGDPSLVLFGQQVTPNAHGLAKQFVLMDNLYCNGEVSEDGHQWCDAAYATDFTERAWTNSYSGRGEPDADDRLTASPGGYIWDNCRAHGLSYYSYGEFSDFKSTPNAPPVFTGDKGLDGHASAKWATYTGDGGFGRDYQKIDVFLDDLKKGEQGGDWPSFMVMSLGEDHTRGLNPKALTPESSVASNDLALGKMVDAISHSKYWKDTAIFVIEDDAQNGPDHVDAHRTVGLVISPYIRRGFVDGTHYTTSSFVRTMEVILGLPPMSQFDAKATPLYRSFTAQPDFTPYSQEDERIALDLRNPESALGQVSAKLDWHGYDHADPDTLNWLLWKALKHGSPLPAPVRSISAP
jgi:YVTN family beta-propeller protein